MSISTVPARRPAWQRYFFAIPVIGWVARDLALGDRSNIWFALVLFLSLWMISGLLFGLPGLYVPAVAMVPLIFIILIVITWS
jgi:hypothetical protein